MLKSNKKEHKEEFASRLRSAIEREGWTAGQTAREARRYLGPSEHLSNAHMWHYLHARSIPRSRYLIALSRALQINPEDLVPDATGASDEANPGPANSALNAKHGAQVQVRNGKEGSALLQINDEVPWATALQILQLLKENARLGVATDEPTADTVSDPT